MRTKIHLFVAPITVVLVAGAAEGLREPLQSRWRVYSSHNAQVRFEIPENWDVYEREVCIGLTPPITVLLLKIAPKEVSEEALLARAAPIEIIVDHLSKPVAVDEWVAEEHSPQDGQEIIKQREIQLAGDVAVLRERRLDREAATITEVFAIRDSRGYFFSFRHDPAHESVFQHLLETLVFQESDGAYVVKALADTASTENRQRVIRMVYLIPSDKEFQQDYAIKMENAIRHLQIWYRNELRNGKSFSLHTPVVEVYNTSHPAIWYQTNPAGSDHRFWFWINVLSDGFALTGGRFNDPDNRWIFYIDADPACNQIGGAGTSGVAVLPANDLRGLAGQQNIPICPNDSPDPFGVCRWVGGLGHELGHAFDLPHPRECEDDDPNTFCPSALMWTGYAIYPNTSLLRADKDILNQSPFFSPLTLTTSLFDCSRLHYLAGRWEATFDWTFSNCPIPPGYCTRCIVMRAYSVTQVGSRLYGFSLDNYLAEILGAIDGDSVNLALKEFFLGGCTRTFKLDGTIIHRRITGTVSGGDDNCGTCRIDGTFKIDIFP